MPLETIDSQHDYHPDYCPCPSCAAWAAWMEDRHAMDALAAADAEVRQAKPATAAEWSDYLDAEFPRAGGAL